MGTMTWLSRQKRTAHLNYLMILTILMILMNLDEDYKGSDSYTNPSACATSAID